MHAKQVLSYRLHEDGKETGTKRASAPGKPTQKPWSALNSWIWVFSHHSVCSCLDLQKTHTQISVVKWFCGLADTMTSRCHHIPGPTQEIRPSAPVPLNWAWCKHSMQLHYLWFYAASLTCQQKEKEEKQAWSLHIPQYISACSTELHWPTAETKMKWSKRSRQLLNGELKWDAGSRVSASIYRRHTALAFRERAADGPNWCTPSGKKWLALSNGAVRARSGEALKHTGTGPGHRGEGHEPKGKSWHGHRAERAAVPITGLRCSHTHAQQCCQRCPFLRKGGWCQRLITLEIN